MMGLLTTSMLMPRRLAVRTLVTTTQTGMAAAHPQTSLLAAQCIGKTHVTQRFTTSKASLSDPKREPPTDDDKDTAFLDRVVGQLNSSIKKHPAETLAVLFASDIGSIGAMYGVLTLSGIEFSPEFALAFAASRPFRRFRLPLDLAAAAAVSKAFPAFSRVRLSDLTGALPNRSIPDTASQPSAASSLVTKTMAKAKDVIDNYGAAYMMGSRLAGVSVVCGLYLLIKQGVDVMPLLAKLGVEDVGTALGSYAAAVVFSSAFYPVTLGVTGYVVPVVAKARKAIMP
uniref:DUF1279 domain-containing protein n=1 Tax=Globisporangium ultimum (strain ATCC 200006 / CBS 805.95 / DAOM BR144) TaxID=431595 RepID=K3W7T4_GLOUD